MLWKYKKVYQETNELTPKDTSCFKLDRISFTNSSTEQLDVYDFKYKKCINSVIVYNQLIENSVLYPSECIILNSLSLNNININLLSIDVQNAIDNNGGELIVALNDVSVTPSILLGTFTFIFSNCSTEPPFTFYIKNQSTNGSIENYSYYFAALLISNPPLGPNQMDFGYADDLDNVEIEITVSNVYPSNNLKVYIENVLTQTIPVSNAGTYLISGITKQDFEILDIILE